MRSAAPRTEPSAAANGQADLERHVEIEVAGIKVAGQIVRLRPRTPRATPKTGAVSSGPCISRDERRESLFAMEGVRWIPGEVLTGR